MKFPTLSARSGPPGTNARVIAKSFDAGLGRRGRQTVSLESAKVVNVVPRYGSCDSKVSGEVMGSKTSSDLRPSDRHLARKSFAVKERLSHHI